MLADQARLKGIAMRPALRAIVGYLAEGRIDERGLRETLDASEMRLLREGVFATRWYPVSSQERVLKVIAKVEGGQAGVIRFGEDTAGDLLDNSAFQLILKGATTLGASEGSFLVRMARLGFDFGNWTFEGGTLESFVIRATQVGPLPDSIAWNIQGFIQHVVGVRTGRTTTCTYERLNREEAIFTSSTS